jgi:outer membrane protein, multidrug efflux system
MTLHAFTPALAVAASLTLLACAGAPPVRAPDVALPAAYEWPSMDSRQAMPDRWWLLYEDAQLTQLVDLALARGFDVRSAISRLQEASAVRREALSRFRLQGDPKLDGEVRRTKNLDTGNLSIPGLPGDVSLGNFFAPTTTRNASATLPVSWELDLFGRRQATARATEADIAAARFDLEAARAALAAGVGRGLFEVRGLMAQLADARATEAIQQRLYELEQRRAGHGLSAASDVDRVAGDLAQARAQAADLQAAVEASKRALLVLVGSGDDERASLVVDAAMPDLPATPATLPGELLVRRPDLLRAQAQLDAASGRLRLADLAFYPTLSLQAALGLASQSGGIVTTTAFGSVGGGITAPLFDRERLHAQLGQADARVEQAVLAYEQAVQKAYGEVDQTLVRFAADRERVALLEAGSARAERAFGASQVRYQRGLSDLQEALDAERAERSARTALTTARVEALQRSVQLFQALGGGWEATR